VHGSTRAFLLGNHEVQTADTAENKALKYHSNAILLDRSGNSDQEGAFSG
jgi:hypothetical protein